MRTSPSRQIKTKHAVIFAKVEASTGDIWELRRIAAGAGYNPKIIEIWRTFYADKWHANRARKEREKMKAAGRI